MSICRLCSLHSKAVETEILNHKSEHQERMCIDLLSQELWFGSFNKIFEIFLITWYMYVFLSRTCLHFTEQRPTLAAGR